MIRFDLFDLRFDFLLDKDSVDRICCPIKYKKNYSPKLSNQVLLKSKPKKKFKTPKDNKKLAGRLRLYTSAALYSWRLKIF